MVQNLDYGKDYVYPHDLEGGYAPDVEYLPEELQGSVFYRPSERGYEQRIKERLQFLKKQSSKEGKEVLARIIHQRVRENRISPD